MFIKQVSSLTRYCRKGLDTGSVPEKPLNCVVRRKKALSDVINCSDSHSDYLDLGDPPGIPKESIAHIQKNLATTLSDSAKDQPNDNHGQVSSTGGTPGVAFYMNWLPEMSASAGAHVEPHYRPQSPCISAFTSPWFPIEPKTVTAPSTSVTSVVFHPRQLTWKDFLCGSQQSCAMESLVSSLKHSSLNDRHDSLSKTPPMKSFER